MNLQDPVSLGTFRNLVNEWLNNFDFEFINERIEYFSKISLCLGILFLNDVHESVITSKFEFALAALSDCKCDDPIEENQCCNVRTEIILLDLTINTMDYISNLVDSDLFEIKKILINIFENRKLTSNDLESIMDSSIKEVIKTINRVKKNVCEIHNVLKETYEYSKIQEYLKNNEYMSAHLRIPDSEDLIIENDTIKGPNLIHNISKIMYLVEKQNFVWIYGTPLCGKTFTGVQLFYMMRKTGYLSFENYVYYFLEPNTSSKIWDPLNDFIITYNSLNSNKIEQINEIENAIVFIDGKNLTLKDILNSELADLVMLANDGKIRLIILSQQYPDAHHEYPITYFLDNNYIEYSSIMFQTFLKKVKDEYKKQKLSEQYELAKFFGLLKNGFFTKYYLNRVRAIIQNDLKSKELSILSAYGKFLKSSNPFIGTMFEHSNVKAIINKISIDNFQSNNETWLSESEPEYLRVFPTPIDYAKGRIFETDDYIQFQREFEQNNLLFIVGDSGTGKTTLAARLILEKWAQGNFTFIYQPSDKHEEVKEIVELLQLSNWLSIRVSLFVDDIHLIPTMDLFRLIMAIKQGNHYAILTMTKKAWKALQDVYKYVIKNQKRYFITFKLLKLAWESYPIDLGKIVEISQEVCIDKIAEHLIEHLEIPDAYIDSFTKSISNNLSLAKIYLEHYLQNQNTEVFKFEPHKIVYEHLKLVMNAGNIKSVNEIIVVLAIVAEFAKRKTPVLWDYVEYVLETNGFESATNIILQLVKLNELHLIDKGNGLKYLTIQESKLAETYLHSLNYFDIPNIEKLKKIIDRLSFNYCYFIYEKIINEPAKSYEYLVHLANTDFRSRYFLNAVRSYIFFLKFIRYKYPNKNIITALSYFIYIASISAPKNFIAVNRQTIKFILKMIDGNTPLDTLIELFIGFRLNYVFNTRFIKYKLNQFSIILKNSNISEIIYLYEFARFYNPYLTRKLINNRKIKEILRQKILENPKSKETAILISKIHEIDPEVAAFVSS